MPLAASLPACIADADLSALNTLGLRARAARLYRIDSLTHLQALCATANWSAQPRVVLGGGSNVVLTGDFSGSVLQVALAGRRLLDTRADAFIVEAGAGENWHDFVCWTLEQGWSGLENLALIPGTVGAAPIQNIGAYGVELAERFASLQAVDLDSGELRNFDAAACAFAYRDSVFKRNPGRWLVASVRFRLPRPWEANIAYAEVGSELQARGVQAPTAQDVADAVIAIRRRKLPDPAQIGNAGSFFKNPVLAAGQAAALLAQHPRMPHYPQADGRIKLAAGWLIEQAGWKGRDLGAVGCFERQALVLVNRGGACGADVVRLARAIETDVMARFGVQLEVEPAFV